VQDLINNNPRPVLGVEHAPKQRAGVRLGEGGRGPSAEILQILSLNIEPVGQTDSGFLWDIALCHCMIPKPDVGPASWLRCASQSWLRPL
jgi:hypothetical protein